MKLVVINGSPRKTGRTGTLARYIERNFDVGLVDLSIGDIPFYNGDPTQESLPSVRNLREMVSQADGVILASPEYHNGMSGVLKNALDFLGSDHFAHKPVALFAVAGGGKGGINALNNMRTVIRGLYGNAIPRQLVIDPDHFDYEKDGLKGETEVLVHKLIEELKIYVKGYLFMWKQTEVSL